MPASTAVSTPSPAKAEPHERARHALGRPPRTRAPHRQQLARPLPVLAASATALHKVSGLAAAPDDEPLAGTTGRCRCRRWGIHGGLDGRAMTPAELARETRSSIEVERTAKGQFVAGESHPNWKGDHFQGKNTGRARAQVRYRDLGTCMRCPRPAVLRHHQDRNTGNNAEANVEFLCKSCHELEHEKDPHKPYPGPSPETIAKWKGRIPWNKGRLQEQCKRGHALDGANVRLDLNGRRHCRACERAWRLEHADVA
jgi:hypothetical protein